MLRYFERKKLRARFLAEQQIQLVRDAKLADPAKAYRNLVAELMAEANDWDKHSDQAA